jgi:SOS-response transcriptional repressor LexA
MTRRAPSAATAADVLHYIAGYLEAHDGISPSYQDICDDLGIHSKSWVDHHLIRLQDYGLLHRLKRRRRAIEVLRPVAIPRAPNGQPLYFVRMQP